MIGRSARRVAGLFLLVACGCRSGGPASTVPPRPFKGVTLTVAALDDPAILATVAPRLGEWEESRGGSVALRQAAVEAVDAAKSADILIVPAHRLGDLIDLQAILPFPESLVESPTPKALEDDHDQPTRPPDDPLAFDAILEPYRELVVRYGPDRQGLAFGGTAFVLVYRRDALDQASARLKSEASSATVDLKPPATWEQLDALAAFLDSHDWRGDGQPGDGIALAGNAERNGAGAEILLARAAALGLHPDFFSFLFDTESMTPLIDSPPFIEALEGMTRLALAGPATTPRDAEAARDAFRRGEVALLIDRAEHARSWTVENSSAPIGVAPLPGSKRVYNRDRRTWEPAKKELNRPSYLPEGGGWLVTVSTASTNPEAAQDLVRYLALAETAEAVRADPSFSMLPVRGALIARGPADAGKLSSLDRASWADAVSRTLMADRVVVEPRIPEASGYLADLESARQAAISGMPAAEVLKAAAQAWNRRTDRLGRDRQTWHLKRSLLGFATDPIPPPRP